MAVVRPERIVPQRVQADVDRLPVRRIELRALTDDVDCRLLVSRILRRANRRRAGVDRDALLRGWQREPPHMPPLRADEGLHLPGHREPVLGDVLIERKRLPEGWVVHPRPRLGDDEGSIHWDKALVGIVASFERAVAPSIPDHRGRDAIAECGR